MKKEAATTITVNRKKNQERPIIVDNLRRQLINAESSIKGTFFKLILRNKRGLRIPGKDYFLTKQIYRRIALENH